ncbi:hypothetical protein HD554DRAFT_2123722 [Boletus coccyginus]|nr:hypothetical protein HD554DRAFT_2123722 [Boletus coccyginus]
MMRDSVLNLGDQPCSFLFGRLGGLLGAFLVSGIFHNLNLERGGHSVVCIGFWLMNGVGVVLERLWKRATGRMVDGIWGRTWAPGGCYSGASPWWTCMQRWGGLVRSALLVGSSRRWHS